MDAGPDPSDYPPPDHDPSDYERDLSDYEPPDPSDFEPDPADYQPDPSDYELNYDDRLDEPDEFDLEIYRQQIYDDAVKQFTEERLQSYYLTNPRLAEPALDALIDAQSLLSTQPLAALVFATTSTELAIKAVLLRPIVSGLVHTEGLAAFITDLATQHTGMDRFRALLTEILAQFGGVDLKTYTRPNSKRNLWQEIDDIQTARNGVIHRGEKPKDSAAPLAVVRELQLQPLVTQWASPWHFQNEALRVATLVVPSDAIFYRRRDAKLEFSSRQRQLATRLGPKPSMAPAPRR